MEVVAERIDPRHRNIGVSGQIGGGVEPDRWVAAFVPTRNVVVVERIDVRRRYVGVGREVAAGVEQRVRIAPLGPANRPEVR